MKRSRILQLAAALAEITVAMPEPVVRAQTPRVQPSGRGASEHTMACPPYRLLSGAEFEMYRLLGKGRRLADIAFYFSLSPQEAAQRLAVIQDKMGCKTLTALRREALHWQREHE